MCITCILLCNVVICAKIKHYICRTIINAAVSTAGNDHFRLFVFILTQEV